VPTSTPPPRPQPRPPGAAATVVLPRWVVGLLVGACAVLVATIMFLLGRATAPAPPAVPTKLAAGASTPAAGARPTEAPDSGPATEYSGAPAATSQPGGGDVDAAAVAAYFGEMDAVAAEAKAGQDPQAVASSILDQAISGNMGGIDDLIATQRALEARLGRIVPPPSCREHHQRSVRLFGRAIALLERTREATTGRGSSDLASMASEGRAIEQEARAVDALANQLRRAAGLPPAS
jgi:hypothetical protein